MEDIKMEENMMATEVMEQMAENTVDTVVSSEKSGSIIGSMGKTALGLGLYEGAKKLFSGLWYKINPKAKAKKIEKQIKKLEKEGYSVTKEQPELTTSDFKVEEDDFE